MSKHVPSGDERRLRRQTPISASSTLSGVISMARHFEALWRRVPELDSRYWIFNSDCRNSISTPSICSRGLETVRALDSMVSRQLC